MEQVVVTIDRDEAFCCCLIPFAIYLDGEKIGVIANGDKREISVSPGRHMLEIKKIKKKIEFEAVAGQGCSFRISHVLADWKVLAGLGIFALLFSKEYWKNGCNEFKFERVAP